MWIVPRADLTEDQLNAVQMSSAKHRVIVGGPGSGKTLVLAHRARQLLTDGIAPARLKVLVYTKVLASYLNEGLDELGLPASAASTFDSWCVGLHKKYVGGGLPMDGKIPDFEAVRAHVLKKIESSNAPPAYDALLVDEGQDLSETAVRLLAATSKHVTLALDSRQQLYSHGIDVRRACDLLDVPRAAASLLSAYRCTPLIVDLAAEFLPSEEEAAEFRAANLLAINGIETPVLFRSIDHESEMNELAGLIGERALLGQSTAVLVPNRYDEMHVAKKLTERGLDVSTRSDLSFGDLRPIVMTYHSAKGLTVDTVFLPGLTSKAFKAIDDEAQRDRLLFVGITRAVRWVWIGTRYSDSLEALDRLAVLVRRSSLKMLPDDEAATVVQTLAPAPAAEPSFNAADLL